MSQEAEQARPAPDNRIIEITLPWPYKGLSPNDRVHDRQKRRVKNKYKQDCFYAARAQIGTWWKIAAALKGKTEIAIDIDLHPPSARWDEDNGVAAFKYGQDGLALALGVDDNRFRVKRRWAEPVKGGRVVVRVAV